MSASRRFGFRRVGAIGAVMGAALAMAAGGTAIAHDWGGGDAKAFQFRMALQDDGVSSLPVSRGPFPDTQNMRFMGQIAPDDLGALPVPGVWAKGMMNDIWGWTSPAGQEYALATNSGGVAIIRVTDPANPVFVGRIEPGPVRLHEHLGRSGHVRQVRLLRDGDRRLEHRRRRPVGT